MTVGILSDVRKSLDVKAMFAQSTMRPCYFRYGYDIAVPLRAYKVASDELRNTAPLDRQYFATFKVNMKLVVTYMIERPFDVGGCHFWLRTWVASIFPGLSLRLFVFPVSLQAFISVIRVYNH